MGSLQLGYAQHAGELHGRCRNRAKEWFNVARHHAGNIKRHFTSYVRLQQLAPGLFDQGQLRCSPAERNDIHL